VFRYRLHSPDGDDLGEATYAMMIKPGEEIHGGGGQGLRVFAVVPFEEEDESPFVGLLQVEAEGAGRGRRESPEARATEGVGAEHSEGGLVDPCHMSYS
jgi:hypothetical protein